MTAEIVNLIRDLENCDIRLWVDGDRLRVNAPKGALTPELRHTLDERRLLLIAALQVDWTADAEKVIAALPDEAVRLLLTDYFEETAGTLEYVQGLARHEAEKQAFGLLLFRILKLGIDVGVPNVTRTPP